MAALCKCFVRCIPPFHAERLLCLPLFTERLRLLYCVLSISCLTAGKKWSPVVGNVGTCCCCCCYGLLASACWLWKRHMSSIILFLVLFLGQFANESFCIQYILGRWAGKWKVEKALPQSTNKTVPYIPSESVCLCVSFGFVVGVHLCVSFVVCVLKGEESGRLGVGHWLQWCSKHIFSTLSNNKHIVVNMFEYR